MSNNNENTGTNYSEPNPDELGEIKLITPEEEALIRNLGETGLAILAIVRRIESQFSRG